VSVRARHFNRV